MLGGTKVSNKKQKKSSLQKVIFLTKCFSFLVLIQQSVCCFHRWMRPISELVRVCSEAVVEKIYFTLLAKLKSGIKSV